jgi:hypothetical protein
MTLKQSRMLEFSAEKVKSSNGSGSGQLPRRQEEVQLKQSMIDSRTYTEAVVLAIILCSLDGTPFVHPRFRFRLLFILDDSSRYFSLM